MRASKIEGGFLGVPIIATDALVGLYWPLDPEP